MTPPTPSRSGGSGARPPDIRSSRPRDRRRVSAEHFELQWRSSRVPVNGRGAEQPLLMMAIPKRLLRKAVDRNTVRRVTREAWRQWRLGAYGQRSAVSNDAGLPVILMRLHRGDVCWRDWSLRVRKLAWRGELDQLFALLPRPDGGEPMAGSPRSGARP